MFAKSIPPRTISVERLLNMSRVVVRDPLGILRREPIQLTSSTSTRPALLPPLPAILSVIYQPPPEWLLQLLAHKITDFTTTKTQPHLQITTQLPLPIVNLNVQTDNIVHEPPGGAQAPDIDDFSVKITQGPNADVGVEPPTEKSDDQPQMITVTQTSGKLAFNSTSYSDVVFELPPIQTPVIPFTKTKQIIHFEPKTTEAPKQKDLQKLVARKKLPTTGHESPT